MKLKGPWRKSKLGSVYICAWLAYAEFELLLPFTPTMPAINGIGGHAFIATDLAYIIKEKNPEKYIESCNVELTDEAVELATKAIEGLPIDPNKIKHIEKSLAVDKKGQPSKSPQHDWYTGTLDVVAEIDGTLCILDHKTGRLQTDPVYERHGYVMLVHAHYPQFKEITFGRYWVRTGQTDWYHYRWERKGRGKQKLFIDDVEHDSRFLYAYIKEKIEHAESLEVVPTPGEHCENLYGEPCPFLGSQCPLAHNGNLVPAENDIVVMPDDPTKYLMGMTPEQRVPAAYRMVLHGLPDDEITPEILDWAKQGHAHVQNANRKVNKRFKQLADRMCFQSGGKWHGMKPKKTVDVEAALSILIGRETPLKEMAKACSISPTGINKISVELEDTKQVLFETCVDDAGGEEFGPIKKVE